MESGQQQQTAKNGGMNGHVAWTQAAGVRGCQFQMVGVFQEGCIWKYRNSAKTLKGPLCRLEKSSRTLMLFEVLIPSMLTLKLFLARLTSQWQT